MINNEIKSKEIKLIAEGSNTVLNTKDALKMASAEGLDLICINPNGDILVCKIGDYSKYLYEQKKKEKENKKKQKPAELKEIKIGDATEINDLRTKAKQIDKFLAAGDKVKLSIRYRGRTVKMISEGPEKLQNLMSLITEKFVIDTPIKTAGNMVFVTIAKK